MSTAHERLVRMFNMGKYGETLAQEILDQHVRELAEKTKPKRMRNRKVVDDDQK